MSFSPPFIPRGPHCYCNLAYFVTDTCLSRSHSSYQFKVALCVLIPCLRCLIFHVPNYTWSPSWRASTTTCNSTTAAGCLPTAPISQSTGRSDWEKSKYSPTTSRWSHFGPLTDAHIPMYCDIVLARITYQIQIILLKKMIEYF